MDAPARFALAVNRPEPSVDTAEACFLIAANVYPELDVASELRRVDALAVRCPPGFDGLRRYLFDELGFRGNTERYDDPRNSFLNDVLDRRVGLPITLSILAIEVGRRVGVPLSGVGMPAHFVVRHDAEPGLFVDAFAGGETLDAAGCRDRFHEIVGQDVPFDPDWLKPVSTTDILLRVLANLKNVYSQKTQWHHVEWVMRCRLSVPGCPAEERRDLAHAIGQQGRFEEAARELDLLARITPDPDARHAITSEAITMRAQLN
ncbi:MAG TPA: transglutaminase-like domain-containing protein [Actinomycetota bacterium]|nr:transglutaminase-like domain-containing protein [Actinomycetota bacterium]